MKLLILLLTLAPLLSGQDRPNILWIMSEDNSCHWLGCYGNTHAQTPHIDKLASQGIRFTNAYSNAAVCAVARSTILTGVHAPTMGTQHMRSRHIIPERYRPNVSYLRDAGYYTSNNNKTDYNFKGNDNSYWDESSNNAHYKNRSSEKPFYAIFNISDSHESSLFNNRPEKTKRVKPEEISVPPYLPDLPEIRKDIARYHDRITDMDTKVGKILEELENSGLAENTIVIYFADHGGILPRGKRYLEQTGVHIPLIVRIPQKFKHLSPFQAGSAPDELISFIDLSPTLLSIAGIDIPTHMQGRAFLGKKRQAPPKDNYAFLYADRFDELYGMRRGITDGKWKYIRNFNPHLPQAPYSFYQFGQPGWQAYQKAWQDDKLIGYHKAQWEPPASSEFLFDLSADPWEINNLATNPAHTEKLVELCGRLKATMLQMTDTGVIPEPMFAHFSEKPIAAITQSASIDFKGILEIAFAATSKNAKDRPSINKALESKDPINRYWAAIGLLTLGKQAGDIQQQVTPLLKDNHSIIRTTAAEALFSAGHKKLATSALIDELSKKNNSESILYLLCTLDRLNLLGQIPKDWKPSTSFIQGNQDYIKRFLETR